MDRSFTPTIGGFGFLFRGVAWLMIGSTGLPHPSRSRRAEVPAALLLKLCAFQANFRMTNLMDRRVILQGTGTLLAAATLPGIPSFSEEPIAGGRLVLPI